MSGCIPGAKAEMTSVAGRDLGERGEQDGKGRGSGREYES